MSPEDVLLHPDRGRPLLDVRTPAEFAHGHLVGAQNLPLFTNAERAEVGTLYKQTSPEAAFLRGLELAGNRMRWYVEEATRLAPDRKVQLHCWRGGQRSSSLGWLLQQAGFQVDVIEGGYKAVRQAGRDLLSQWPRPLLILGGPTGAAKTEVLHLLAQRGEAVVDLEGLAHHKGSSFGALGESPQPSVEQFENELFAAFAELDEELPRPVWLENESRAIGRVFIPQELWSRMRKSALLILDTPLEWRVDHLVRVYAQAPKQELIDSFERIRKRLGGQHVQRALAALEVDDFAEAARIALQYYDKAYAYSVERSGMPIVDQLAPTNPAPAAMAELLAQWLDAHADHPLFTSKK
ncbi:MAG: tRNA 2-selenouridine(34) synthase MnmH [Lewinella sp.]|nr:tRNA 2-selenouridine(34) synthase MnmH [Lewinella sp.]